ncbi:hypothetical protein KC332_g7923 [Hortaea werneckii]|nr:hypothetical protein KC358_g11246 [Hortaea werneckii]KAI6832341.1 hypothetical protein KC350_g7165 [Hortaea werneckii]KAI6928280.1 hypothetical protein KC348_g8160 [Hortaea werneckii]KAI6934497.1 hypothetical protein KC341_g7576 [Hortaea werneckii]KAI6964031.1 hypothetical protein KC321_g10904 [Hortaea werneckii]
MDNAARAALRRQDIGFGSEPASYNGLSYSAFQDGTVQQPPPVRIPGVQQSPRTAATLRQQHHVSSNDRGRLANSRTQHQPAHLTSYQASCQANNQARLSAELKTPEVREVVPEDTPRAKKRRSISVAVKESVARPKHEATKVRFEPEITEATSPPAIKNKQSTSFLRKAANAPKKAFQWYTGTGPRPPRGPTPPPCPAAVSTNHYGLMARAARSSPHLTGTPADFRHLDLDREYHIRAHTPRSMSASQPLSRPDQAYIRPMGLMRSAHEADMYAMRRREFERTLDGAVQEALEKRPPPRKFYSYARATTTPPVSGPGGASARTATSQVRSYSTPTVPGWSPRSSASLPACVSPWTSQPTVVGTSSPASRSWSPFMKLQSPQCEVGSPWSSPPHTPSISAAYTQPSVYSNIPQPWTGSPVSSPPTTPGYPGMTSTAVPTPSPSEREKEAIPWSRGEQVLALAQGQRQPASPGPNGKTFRLFGTNTYRGIRYFSSPHDPLKPPATTPPRAEDWRQSIPVFAHRPEQVSHFADRPLSEKEKARLRGGEETAERTRESRPQIPRALTAPANLPSQSDEDVPLQVLRDGKLRNRWIKRMTRDRRRRSTPSPPRPVPAVQQAPTTGHYDAHSAASSNQSRQPSITSVMLGGTIAAPAGIGGVHGPVDGGYTRRESFVPGERGRPAATAARYRAGRNIKKKSGMSDLRMSPGSASASRGVDEWNSGPRSLGEMTGSTGSKSEASHHDVGRMESREQDNRTPFRLKPQGSLASLDYGRISGTGVLANRVSSIAGSLRHRGRSPDSVSYSTSVSSPASQGRNKDSSCRARVEDFYAAHQVRERLNWITRICEDLLTSHDGKQLPRRYQDGVLTCMEERRMIEEWGMNNLYNLPGPSSPPMGRVDLDRKREGSASDGCSGEEEQEAERFNSLRHMLRSLEREVERVRQEIVQDRACAPQSSRSPASVDGGQHSNNGRPRSWTKKLRRAGHFVRPVNVEDEEVGEGDDSDTESKLKGSGAKRSLSTNF